MDIATREFYVYIHTFIIFKDKKAGLTDFAGPKKFCRSVGAVAYCGRYNSAGLYGAREHVRGSNDAIGGGNDNNKYVIENKNRVRTGRGVTANTSGSSELRAAGPSGEKWLRIKPSRRLRPADFAKDLFTIVRRMIERRRCRWSRECIQSSLLHIKVAINIALHGSIHEILRGKNLILRLCARATLAQFKNAPTCCPPLDVPNLNTND